MIDRGETAVSLVELIEDDDWIGHAGRKRLRLASHDYPAQGLPAIREDAGVRPKEIIFPERREEYKINESMHKP